MNARESRVKVRDSTEGPMECRTRDVPAVGSGRGPGGADPGWLFPPGERRN